MPRLSLAQVFTHRALAVAAAVALVMLPTSCTQSTALIQVDFSKTAQTIDGWEVTPRMWEYDKLADRYNGAWLKQKDEIAHKLVEEAGVTRVRLELRSGIENPVDNWSKFTSGELSYQGFKSLFYEKINDNDDPNAADPAGFQWSQLDHYVTNFAIPLRDALAARGEKLRVSLCYVDFRWTDRKGTLSHANAPEEYAEIVTLAVQRLKEKFNIDVDMIEVILEPDNTDHWSGENIGRGAVAASKRLAAAGFNPTFIGPSTAAASHAIDTLNAAFTVPGAKDVIRIFSYHRYDNPWATDNIDAIRNRAKADGMATSMLEYTYASVSDLFVDLGKADATAWQLYGAVGNVDKIEQADQDYLLFHLPDDAIQLTPKTYEMAQVFLNVRPGAVRVNSTFASGPAQSLAFRNADGSEVVALNLSGSSNVTISGLPAGAWQTSFVARDTTKAVEGKAEANAAGQIEIKTPGAGLMIIKRKAKP